MGDLPITSALTLWENKFIWVNFPSAISTLPAHPPQAVKRYLIECLESLIPGERVALIVSTENRVPEQSLMAMIDIMESATLPLSNERIGKLYASVDD
jgi:hypothetical protein